MFHFLKSSRKEVIPMVLTNKIKNNDLNISTETIEKIIDLFNNFEAALYLSKGQRSNNPTSLLIELMLSTS